MASQNDTTFKIVVKIQQNHLPLSIKIIPLVLLKCIWVIYRTMFQETCWDLQSSGGVNFHVIIHRWSSDHIYCTLFPLMSFSLMVSHKRFLMRQYKYKCSDMPFFFLLIFFPLGFRGVFSGTSYCTHFHSFSLYEFTI